MGLPGVKFHPAFFGAPCRSISKLGFWGPPCTVRVYKNLGPINIPFTFEHDKRPNWDMPICQLWGNCTVIICFKTLGFQIFQRWGSVSWRGAPQTPTIQNTVKHLRRYCIRLEDKRESVANISTFPLAALKNPRGWDHDDQGNTLAFPPFRVSSSVLGCPAGTFRINGLLKTPI